MGITADNRLTFVPGASKSITRTINGSSAWDHSFYAWGINYDFHCPASQKIKIKYDMKSMELNRKNESEEIL